MNDWLWNRGLKWHRPGINSKKKSYKPYQQDSNLRCLDFEVLTGALHIAPQRPFAGSVNFKDWTISRKQHLLIYYDPLDYVALCLQACLELNWTAVYRMSPEAISWRHCYIYFSLSFLKCLNNNKINEKNTKTINKAIEN